jgi:hypothetical protein
VHNFVNAIVDSLVYLLTRSLLTQPIRVFISRSQYVFSFHVFFVFSFLLTRRYSYAIVCSRSQYVFSFAANRLHVIRIDTIVCSRSRCVTRPARPWRHCHYHAAPIYLSINVRHYSALLLLLHCCFTAVLLLQAYVHDVTAITTQLLFIFRSTLSSAAVTVALLFHCCRHTSMTSLPLSCSFYLSLGHYCPALLPHYYRTAVSLLAYVYDVTATITQLLHYYCGPWALPKFPDDMW